MDLTGTTDPIVYQVRASRKGFDNEVDIAIMSVHPRVAVCEEIRMKVIDPGEPVDPCITITFEEAVGLMTDLWNAGVRPEGVDLADSKTLIAVQQHLNDMRMYSVAFWNKLSGAKPSTGGGPGKQPDGDSQ
jgi:hypothetical protein